MCAAAIEFEKCQVLERVREALSEADNDLQLPSFNDDWELAPLCHTRYVEPATAEYWYHVGRKSKEQEMLTLQNQDMREMLRVGSERIMR
jgi:hypothetical protein